MKKAEIIIGYKTYMNLVKPLLKEQQVENLGCAKEMERGIRGIELAAAGHNVAVISSGDPESMVWLG